jgi:hypothetical protein
MPDFVYPERDANVSKELADLLQSKEDFGLAFAGGGLRGAYLTHGIVRTLRKAQLLEKARYMSLSSGSVWLGVALQYQTQDPLDVFLGEALTPQQCTPKNLVSAEAGSYVTRLPWPFTKFPKNMSAAASEHPRSLSETAAGLDAELRTSFERLHGLERGIIDRLLHCLEHLCDCAVNAIIPEGSLHEVWSLLTGYLALHPFGLAHPYSQYCHAVDADNTRLKLGRHATIYSTQDMQNKLPYLISQSAVMASQTGTDQKRNPLLSFPLEQTPMYSGVPTAYPAPKESARYGGIGDALVDSIGFNGKALQPLPNTSRGEVEVSPRQNLFNIGALADWAGTATAYVAAFQIRPWVQKVPQCAVTAFEKLMPHAWLWSPLDADERNVPISKDLPVGDAGIFDDIGHLPLLRRNVKKMVIYDSSAVHDDVSKNNSDLEEMVYLQAAFGQPGGLVPPNPAGSPNPMSPENFLTVFEPSEFAKLWSKVKELHGKGKPVVIRDFFTVVDNPWFGIAGGWQVEIVWVIALPVEAWRNALPVETSKNLPPWFPNVLSSEPTSLFEFSALSQYGSWLTETAVVKEIQAMLSGEKGAPEAHVDSVFV